MHRHLVAVKIRIKRRADQGMKLDRFSLNQDRLKGLNSKPVERRRPVEENAALPNDLIKDIPDFWRLPFHHFFRTLNGGNKAFFIQFIIDKRLKQLQSHLLRQSALMKAQIRPDNDNGTTRIVHTLSKEILPEPSLFSLEHIAEGLERSLVGTGNYFTPSPIVKKNVHGFLQHSLFISNNNIRCVQFKEPFQPIIPINDAAVKIIQIRSGKTASIKGNKWSQVRRQYGNHIQDRPFRLVL